MALDTIRTKPVDLSSHVQTSHSRESTVEVRELISEVSVFLDDKFDCVLHSEHLCLESFEKLWICHVDADVRQQKLDRVEGLDESELVGEVGVDSERIVDIVIVVERFREKISRKIVGLRLGRTGVV